jgi:hypothetical protein
MSKALMAAALAVAMMASGARAQDLSILDGESVRAAITGKTIQLQTKIGVIPISFKADGTMIGRSQELANWLGRSMDQGQWWIVENQLCQRWKLWMDAKPYCFTLRQAGETVQWTRNDGLKGTLVVRAE